jgi:hypothetical protein
MPTFRKLTPEEQARVQGIGPRKMVEIEYDRYLSDFSAGDFGEATLGPNETRLMVMNRLKAAAGRRSPKLRLIFRRTSDPALLRFRVEPDEDSPRPVEVLLVGSDAPPSGRVRKKRG